MVELPCIILLLFSSCQASLHLDQTATVRDATYDTRSLISHLRLRGGSTGKREANIVPGMRDGQDKKRREAGGGEVPGKNCAMPTSESGQHTNGTTRAAAWLTAFAEAQPDSSEHDDSGDTRLQRLIDNQAKALHKGMESGDSTLQGSDGTEDDEGSEQGYSNDPCGGEGYNDMERKDNGVGEQDGAADTGDETASESLGWAIGNTGTRLDKQVEQVANQNQTDFNSPSVVNSPPVITPKEGNL